MQSARLVSTSISYRHLQPDSLLQIYGAKFTIKFSNKHTPVTLINKITHGPRLYTPGSAVAIK